jgi:hypothetical protein
MNARRALKPASGGARSYKGKQYHPAPKYAPANELELEEQTALAIESAWSDHRIAAEVMWQQIFERFGFLRAETVDEIPF